MRLSCLALLLIVASIVAGCGGPGESWSDFARDSGKLRVAASFYPIYEVVRYVGGNRVDAVNLVPPNAEPHDWEPTARQIATLREAAVFVYNGSGLEHWVPKTLGSLGNKSILTVESTAGFDLIGSGDGGYDPHIWLDPMGLAHQVRAVRDALIQADSANRAVYEANAAAYLAGINELHHEFERSLIGCTRREFFTSHAAFAYLARRYNLDQHALMGLAPDAEPKPRELARIVAEAKRLNVAYIFFETLASDKVATVVAEEIGAQTLVLNPFEGLTDEEVRAGRNYLFVMRENLANLETALECGK